MKQVVIIAAVAAVVGGMWPRPAEAETGPMCGPAPELLPLRETLRAISLDLRGRPPSMEEYARAEERGEVPEALIEEWMAEEAFFDRVVRRHRELFWPNVSDQLFLTPQRSMNDKPGENGNRLWYLPKHAPAYRGAKPGEKRPYCDDEPATFGPDGEIQCEMRDGICYEGWVEVRPYWDPENPIKVCAFDAQDELVSSNGNRCDTDEGTKDPECGCGPNLIWCAGGPYIGYKGQHLHESLHEDFRRRIKSVIRRGEPYAEIFTNNRAFVNGPLVQYLTNLLPFDQEISFNPVAYEVDALPDIPAHEVDTWEEIELPDYHSGLLTSPVYLLRFQTRRARLNRFFEAFLCSPFYAPPEAFANADTEAAKEPDLQKREGCKTCHATIEPMSMFWGRWPERTAGYLSRAEWPIYRADCAACGGTKECSRKCKSYFKTRKNPELGGLWKLVEFIDEQHWEHLNQGPDQLVKETLGDGRFSQCTVRRTMEWLMDRPPARSESDWVEQLEATFLDSGQDYRALVEAIISSDAYRRIK